MTASEIIAEAGRRGFSCVLRFGMGYFIPYWGDPEHQA